MCAELHITMGTLLTPAARSSYPCEGRSSVTSSISIYTSLRCTYLHITDQYLSKAATRVPRFQYYNSPNVLRPLHLSPLLHHPHRNVHHQPPQTHAHEPAEAAFEREKAAITSYEEGWDRWDGPIWPVGYVQCRMRTSSSSS
jgi:hypothetical protein